VPGVDVPSADVAVGVVGVAVGVTVVGVVGGDAPEAAGCPMIDVLSLREWRGD